MAIPILKLWKKYFLEDRNEGMGSSYERVMLNQQLARLRLRYAITSVLEVPVFGFTGLSGINSMGLAQQGLDVHLIDTDPERRDLIAQIWKEVQLPVDCRYQPAYTPLPFADKSLEFAWNFSALWFVDDLTSFLRELTRVISKVIMICVPNRSGLGYLSQKYFSGATLRKLLHEEYIIPQHILAAMAQLGWSLRDHNYIDCPPWPDIGMAKEDFLKLFGLGFWAAHEPAAVPFYSILDFYAGRDDAFAEKMLRYAWVETHAPRFLKYFWAHHKYFIFEPVSDYK